jgi:hypothetical protein
MMMIIFFKRRCVAIRTPRVNPAAHPRASAPHVRGVANDLDLPFAEPSAMPDPVTERLGYHPLWLDRLADGVILEGSVLEREIRGAEDVRTMLAYARSLYDFQRFSFVGDVGDGYWLETYASRVAGVAITNTAIVHRSGVGETDHIAMTHRPLGALHLFSSLLRQELGDRFGPGLFLVPVGGVDRSTPEAGPAGGVSERE